MNKDYGDISKEELISQMKERANEGWTCFVKWTCEKCGERVACNSPNEFFEQGYIHEECGHNSHPKRFGLLLMKEGGNNK